MGRDEDTEWFPTESDYARILNHDTVLKDSHGPFLYTVKMAGHNCF